jgi:hypothetical protein
MAGTRGLARIDEHGTVVDVMFAIKRPTGYGLAAPIERS